ncbi:uncharacterized protein LOC115442971 [Manduca sexta]|uniref:Uncharacterized protein n=1 Tax=Manduca sexta TaxID=7130 RepID=A0A921Z0W1_MANSE|nr:uncharacterized protein LOC115442971 [Manduca sexta]KAG6449279.1 hypothetical protein O3G_MSEX005944 [Manduca sexta]
MESTTRIDVKSCERVEPPHPCDPVVPCDPLQEPEGDCPAPSICLERLKNPAYPGEITRCLSGSYINVKSCAKVEPNHPCDILPPCSSLPVKKRRPCNDPPLCLHRIKNPEKKPEIKDPCDPNK